MYEYNLGLRAERIATEHADRQALWFDVGQHVTYRDLNVAANRTADLLGELGTRPRDVVCLSGEKTIEVFAAVLAALKLGAPYVILDPDSPPERLKKILTTCTPRIAIGTEPFLQKVADNRGGSQPVRTSVLEVRTAIADSRRSSRPPASLADITGSTPAYIMYTSGSTGIPKGAVMSHANVLNLIAWGQSTYGITPSDVLTNVNPLYFDNAVFDFYAALFNGARLVPFSKEEVRDPKVLVEKVDRAACTQWFSVPSLLIFLQSMKATDGRHLRGVKRFIFGGEAYPKAKLKQLFDTYSSTAELHNVYGPTECTCICSSYCLSASDFDRLDDLPPLGRIAANFSFLILDDTQRPVSPGELGELCLLGPNVGLGYYNDPDRTAMSFVTNPTNPATREVMYRTGDMVRLNPATLKIHIEGRRDHQIKHMGYRIELEEIESALHCLEYVSEAMALHQRIKGLSHITAVIVVRPEIDDARIKTDLAKLIPDYMVPGTIHREPMLPRNSNGKLDRRGLAEKYGSIVS